MLVCIIVSIFGCVQQVFSIQTKDAPKIQKFSFKDNILEGEIVSVQCFAVAKTIPILYGWMKNGKKISSVENIRFSNTDEISSLILDPVSLNDSGNYTCTASNSAGSDQFTTLLSVKARPHWISTPSDTITTLGSIISLECVASGSPMPTIKWKKYSGSKSSDLVSLKYVIDEKHQKKNNSLLRIPSVTYEDAGTYSCEADNGISPNIAANFSIVVRVLLNVLRKEHWILITLLLIKFCISENPKIKKFAFEDSVKQGDVASVMCFATSPVMPIRFHWEKDGIPISEAVKHAKIEDGSSHSVLALHSVVLSDNGNYTCVASTLKGSDKHTAELNVKAPPQWLEEPKRITTKVGETISIRCLATGSPKPFITWRKFEENSKMTEINVDGETTSKHFANTYTISPVSSDVSGVYECIASNGIEPSLKSNFTITIRDPPKVKQFHFDDNIREGDVASVTCLATSGLKPVKFQWTKNGIPISSSDIKVRIDDGAIHSVLVFDSVEPDDDGNYSCIALNADGQDTFTAQLNVRAPPKWKEEPRSVTTKVGETLKINCIAFGSPTPHVKWRKLLTVTNEFIDLKPTPGNEAEFGNGFLQLVPVSDNDSGIYECIASNGILPDIRSNFSITIRAKDIPRIQPFSFPENIVEGSMVTVTCVSPTKTKPIYFSWSKNNIQITPNDENIKISSTNDVSVLILNPVTLENSGNYSCSATNSEGSDIFSTTLHVKASPKWQEQPMDIITNVGASIKVACRASGSPQPTISWRKLTNENLSESLREIRNSSTFQLSPVLYENAGLYECIADNGIQPKIRTNFSLTIRASALLWMIPLSLSGDVPEIQKFNFQEDALEGKRISVTCILTSKSDPVTFAWYRNGKEISSDPNLTIKNHKEYSLMILDPVRLEDNANYTCKATNIHGSNQHAAYLQVKAPPKWLEIPRDIITTIGENLSILCSATGSPQPKIQFKKIKDKNNVPISVNARIQNLNESSNQLKLQSVSYEDAGTYECIADNGIASAIHNNFSIIVHVLKMKIQQPKLLNCIQVYYFFWTCFHTVYSKDIPVIERFNFKENVKEGDFVSVVCLVKSGQQPIVFTWHKNNEEVKVLSKSINIENSPVISALILNKVSSESDGNYTCTAKNSLGSDQHSSILKVKAPPKWIRPPTDIVTVIGDEIKINCVASGSPAPQIKWKKYEGYTNQAPVIEAGSFLNVNDSVLKFPKIAYSDAGVYECVADNGIPPILKANFTITIRESPIIKKFQFEENVKEGDFVSVVCIIKDGSQPISFEWFKNGDEFKTSNKDTRIENSPITSVLILNSVTSESDGNYTCTARNSFGRDQHSSSLKVKAPPKWLSQAKDITTVMGDAIIAECLAKGSPKPRIHWKKYTASSAAFSITSLNSTSNTDDTVLKFARVSYEDAGVYECSADNGIPPIIKHNFTISIRGEHYLNMTKHQWRSDTVFTKVIIILDFFISITAQIPDAPKIQKFTFQDNIQEGDVISVTCLAVSSSRPLTFLWSKNEVPIDASSNHIRIDNSGEYSLLILENVSLKSSGNYTCSVANSFGKTTHTAKLDVKASPKWVEKPTSVVTTIGATVKIRCAATGSPSPNMKWIKLSVSNNSEILQVDKAKVSGNTTELYLNIPSVSYKDGGAYECLVSNEIGPTLRANFSITIRDVPEIQKFSFQDNVIEGKVVSVTCLAVSEAKPLQFRWEKNGKILEENTENIKIEHSTEFSILILNRVTSISEGNYTCTATNTVGSAKYSAYLSVKAPPKWITTPPDKILAIGESVTLKCSATGSPKPKVTWSRYSGSEFRRTDVITSENVKVNADENTLQIQSLTSDDSGLYECLAIVFTGCIGTSFSEVKIEPFNFPRRFKVGEKAQATCFVSSASDRVQLQWYKDETLLTESENVRLKSSNDFTLIIIDPIFMESEGNYTCKVTDGTNVAQHSAHLQVEAAPTWLEETKNITAAIGSRIVIHCRAHGSPKPNIVLKQITTSNSLTATQEFQDAYNNGSFQLNPITSDHEGIYICSASNGVGVTITKNFSISVEGILQFSSN
ncbi:hypothetical protein JTE90_017454 [Oedothorax gibbosus]|uniref:Ig-like domain-containing protein n=1 Tax=Oedothorax gibbosus TaxID=931172 RepID=A0AAV6U0Y9_9ARAC|nr:hypothetical protein JTE90_017454 [Oedothorax gibbosus]